MLTEKFSQILVEVESLNENDQNELASLIHEEIKWAASFASSQDVLFNLASEALSEFQKGNTLEIDCK